MEQDLIRERYDLSMARIQEILTEETVPENYRDYFRKVTEFIIQCGEVLKAKEDGSLDQMTLEEGRTLNHKLYADVLPENYETSYTNPAYAVKTLGEEYGKLLSYLYAEIRGDIIYAFEGRVLDLVIGNEALIEIYNLFEGETLPAAKEIKDVLYWSASDYCDVTLTYRVQEGVDPKLDFAKKIIMESDLSDLSYLYRFGAYISPEEEKTAAFLNSLPEEEIRKMADTYTDGYIRGFEVMGRDLSKKKTVSVRYPIGFERMVRQAVKNFESAGLSVIFCRSAVGSINRNPAGHSGYASSSPNRQYDYDHRYDSAVYMDKAFRDRKIGVLKTAYEQYKEDAAAYAGPAVIETFGEPGFEPVNKPEAWAFTEKQQNLYLEYRNLSMPVVNEYIPGDETSFTIIAFPVPAIGADFEQIFAETIRINTLDYEVYKEIQQHIIDVLDQAKQVHVTGRNGNETDIRVSLHTLSDPSKQTNFENCVADVNIPVGEVFTSPKLTGTTGLLHVSGVYLDGLYYKDLVLSFTDGMVTDYDCGNYENTDENRRYIRENVLYHHDTLPMGEFAIGTNTTAYVAARKYGIEALMPILIAEKTGPHFAVGDTCYSWEEDVVTHNPDGKKIIAKENECSALRRKDPGKAYFNCHTDITIPYEELDEIAVIQKDGTKVPIIQKGRFVLPGTEELNVPLDEWK
mgnify:CR=1 FL=1